MSVRITCINKAGGNHENPHVAIQTLGWVNEATNQTGRTSREDMYDFIKRGGEAFVKDAKGDIAPLIAEISPLGTKFVKTRPDNTRADNLLTLQECR